MTLFLQCYLELEMFLLGSLTYNLVLVVSLKTHPPHQVFPRTLPLFLASSSLEPSPPLSPGNFSWDHPIYRRGYNNIELHKGDGPSLYFSLPGKLLIYAKCPLSPQQTSSVHWDNWERQAFSCYKKYSISSTRAKATFFPIFTQCRGTTQVVLLQTKTYSKVTSVFYLEGRVWQLVDMTTFPDKNFLSCTLS